MKPQITIFFLLSLIVLITCKKADSLSNKIEFLGSKFFECTSSSKGAAQNDSVWIMHKNDTLELILGFNTTCCATYSTNCNINNDTIHIDIALTKPGSCNCICYSAYHFSFYDFNSSCEYVIDLDKYKSFTGKINK
jgi:hypothetical protein